MKSQIDEAVRQFRLQVEHEYIYDNADPENKRYCKRCGLLFDQTKKEDGTYIPCKGFI